VGLQAEFPRRILRAPGAGFPGKALPVGAVHGLQEKMLEIHVGEHVGERPILAVDELQFVAMRQDDGRTSFGRYADPVNPTGRGLCTIGFDTDVEALAVKCSYKFVVELQKRLTARADHIWPGNEADARWPWTALGLDGKGPLECSVLSTRGRAGRQFALPDAAYPRSQFLRRAEFPAARPICADKVRIAKTADCPGAVLLTTRPQIAAGKAQEYGRAAGMPAFSLDGFIDFLYAVH